jgi:hypothetical protein
MEECHVCQNVTYGRVSRVTVSRMLQFHVWKSVTYVIECHVWEDVMCVSVTYGRVSRMEECHVW